MDTPCTLIFHYATYMFKKFEKPGAFFIQLKLTHVSYLGQNFHGTPVILFALNCLYAKLNCAQNSKIGPSVLHYDFLNLLPGTELLIATAATTKPYEVCITVFCSF